MRLLTVLAAAASTLTAASAAHAGSVEIRDAVARVTVIPEDRADIKVEFLTRNASLPIAVRTQGDKTIVDGGLERRIRACHGSDTRPTVTVAGVGEVSYADMPQLVIRTPRDVSLSAGGAVFGAVGRSASLDLANAGCGDWTVANVAGKLRFNQAGSGDARIGSAAEANLRIAGSGDIDARQVTGPLKVEVAGSGDVAVAGVTGPLDVRVAGSGDVHVAGGRAREVTVSVAGSGDVDFRGEAGDLKAHVAGSGDVRVRAVTGTVSKSVMGSGAVTIG